MKLQGMINQARIDEVLLAYSKSNLSQKKFSKQVGICPATLSNWLRRRRALEAPSGFVPVVTRPEGSVLSLELEYPGGVKLRVSSADLELVARLVRL